MSAARAGRSTARRGRAREERPRLHAVILAGGSGERFWPLSRRAHPKPFLPVLSGRSLMAATFDRARQTASLERTWVVCGSSHVAAVQRETDLPKSRILVEPRRRNTAMAAAVAAARISEKDPEAVLLVLPADHVIPDTSAFSRAVHRAAKAATEAGVLVTLGVRPTRPETGYGYIQLGPAAGDGHPGLHRVRRFVEKPDAARARRYLARGNTLWNAGIFIWTARTLLEEVAICAPQIDRCLGRHRRRPRGPWKDALEAAYRRAPSLPVDVAVLERSRRVWTLPVDFHWNDLGTWASLAEELGVERDGTRVLHGDVLAEQSSGNLVWGDHRPVVLLGVEGLAVVDTGDALLVTKLSSSPELRHVVERLREEGHEDLL